MKIRQIAVILMLFIFLYGMGVADVSEKFLFENPQLNSKIQYGFPIVIADDDQFETFAINEGWSGSGTQLSPYVISNDDISDPINSLTLINISNTQKFFILESNDLLGGKKAVYLDKVQHGVIRNNYINGSTVAFDFRNCSDITVYSNTIADFSTAFELTDCTDISIFSHSLQGGSYSFELNYVTNTLIANNWMNGSGIGAWFCDNLNISYNTIQNTHSAIWFDDGCNNSLIESNILNTLEVNGIVLYDNCHNNEVLDNTISSVGYYGMRLRNSNHTRVVGNSIDDIHEFDGIGLLLNYASFNTIQNNNITDGTKYGLELFWPCLYNDISNNIIRGSDTGVYVANSWVANNTFLHNQIDDHRVGINEEGGGNLYLENTITQCYYGAYVNSNTNFTKNSFGGPGGFGVQIDGENNTLKENIISSCSYYGIYGYYGSRNNTLIGNQINSCNQSAIGLAQASNYTIIDNFFTSNYGDFHFYNSLVSQYYHDIRNNYVNGREVIYITDTENPVIPDNIGSLILINCSYFDVVGLTFENVRAAILVLECHDFRISNNLFRFLHSAVEMRLCENVTIENNEIYNCTGTGIWTLTAHDIVLYNNQIHTSSLKYGDPPTAISLYNVNKGYLSTNSILDCPGYAIRCEASEEVTIIGTRIQNVYYGIYSNTDENMSISNNQLQNCYYGIQLISTTDSEVFGNWIENSTTFGVYLSGATDNAIFLNNFLDNNQFGLQAEDTFGSGNSFYRNFWNDHVEDDLNSDGFKDSAYSFTTNSDPESLSVPYQISLPTLITPTVGEELNKIFTISWSAATETLGYNITYHVFLSCDGGETWQFVALGLETTSITWEAPSKINSTNCLISILAVNDLQIYSEFISSPLTILNYGISTPIIQYPNDGTTLGGTINIQWDTSIDLWNSSATVTYSVYLSSDGGVSWSELATDITVTSYIWLTDTLDDGFYLIKVVAENGDGLSKENIVTLTIENASPTTTTTTEVTEPINTTTGSVTSSTSEKSKTSSGLSWLLLFASFLAFSIKKRRL